MRSDMSLSVNQYSDICQQNADGAKYQTFDILATMQGIGGRLRQARKEAKLTQQQLADKAGLTQPAIAELESGRSKDTSSIVELAKAVGRSPEWLKGEHQTRAKSDVPMLPSGPTLDGYTAIGRYDASFSMGPGALVADHPEPLGYWIVESQWLSGLTRASPDVIAIVKADGDSMTPTLLPGDWVVVDRSQTRLSREGIYAIRVGDDLWIKRMSLNLREKTVRIISDNATTPVQEVEESDLTVIGRVIAIVARRVA